MKRQLIVTSLLTALAVNAPATSLSHVNVSNADVNFSVKTFKNRPFYKPIGVIRTDERTYIRFDQTIAKSQRPEIFVKGTSGKPPSMIWQNNYVVLNRPVKSVQIATPSGQPLYEVTVENTFNLTNIKPAPRLTGQQASGFIIGANLGTAHIKDKFGFNGGVKWGYDALLTGDWLVGFELGGQYDGSMTSDKNDQAIQAGNANVQLRFSRVFGSGWMATAQAGLAYVWYSNNDQTDLDNGVAPLAGINFDYLFPTHISLGLGYRHLFSTPNIESTDNINLHVTYHF